MQEYKKKVKENETIFVAIERDEDKAGLSSVAFPYAAKTGQP